MFGTPVAFGILWIRSVFSTLRIIPSEFWHICCTLEHLTFGTPVGTLYQLVHKVVFSTLGSLLIMFGTFGTVFTFGIRVAFGRLR